MEKKSGNVIVVDSLIVIDGLIIKLLDRFSLRCYINHTFDILLSWRKN